MSPQPWNRKIHRWIALATAVPLLIVLVSGVILQFKKSSDWIQPPTKRGAPAEPSLSLAEILQAARQAPQAQINDWSDIDRIDVRPGKQVAKVRSYNRYEVQIDTSTGELLQVMYRRSDLIEAIHDGSFFSDSAKLWVFFPAALGVLVLWGTGLYLFFQPWLRRRRQGKAPR